MRILMLGQNTMRRYDWGLQFFRNEIANQQDVIFYGTGHPEYERSGKHGWHVPDLLKVYAPIDVIIIEGFRYCNYFTGLNEITNVLKVCTLMDYYGVNCTAYNNFLNKNKINVVTIPYINLLKVFQKNKSKGIISKDIFEILVPHSVETTMYKPLNLPIEYDVMSVSSISSAIYPNRFVVYNELAKINDIKIIRARSPGQGIVRQRYIEVLNKSKMFVNAVDINKMFVMKFTEILACGTFLLTECPDDLIQLGYINKKHLVLYSGMDDMKNKIRQYLKDVEARCQIAKTGMEFVRKNYSNEIVVKQLMIELESQL